MYKPLEASAIVLAAALASCATLGNGPAILTDRYGRTVYTFDRDRVRSGKSECTGSCLREWPPVPAADRELGGDFGAILRQDGTRQLSYKGRPLYYYWRDEAPGEMRGDKFNRLWHIVPLGSYYYDPIEPPYWDHGFGGYRFFRGH